MTYKLEFVTEKNIKKVRYKDLHEIYHYELRGKFKKDNYLNRDFYMIQYDNKPIFVGGMTQCGENYVLDGLFFDRSRPHIRYIIRLIRKYLCDLPSDVFLKCIAITIRSDIRIPTLLGMKKIQSNVDGNGNVINIYGYV